MSVSAPPPTGSRASLASASASVRDLLTSVKSKVRGSASVRGEEVGLELAMLDHADKADKAEAGEATKEKGENTVREKPEGEKMEGVKSKRASKPPSASATAVAASSGSKKASVAPSTSASTTSRSSSHSTASSSASGDSHVSEGGSNVMKVVGGLAAVLAIGCIGFWIFNGEDEFKLLDGNWAKDETIYNIKGKKVKKMNGATETTYGNLERNADGKVAMKVPQPAAGQNAAQTKTCTSNIEWKLQNDGQNQKVEQIVWKCGDPVIEETWNKKQDETPNDAETNEKIKKRKEFLKGSWYTLSKSGSMLIFSVKTDPNGKAMFDMGEPKEIVLNAADINIPVGDYKDYTITWDEANGAKLTLKKNNVEVSWTKDTMKNWLIGRWTVPGNECPLEVTLAENNQYSVQRYQKENENLCKVEGVQVTITTETKEDGSVVLTSENKKATISDEAVKDVLEWKDGSANDGGKWTREERPGLPKGWFEGNFDCKETVEFNEASLTDLKGKLWWRQNGNLGKWEEQNGNAITSDKKITIASVEWTLASVRKCTIADRQIVLWTSDGKLPMLWTDKDMTPGSWSCSKEGKQGVWRLPETATGQDNTCELYDRQGSKWTAKAKDSKDDHLVFSKGSEKQLCTRQAYYKQIDDQIFDNYFTHNLKAMGLSGNVLRTSKKNDWMKVYNGYSHVPAKFLAKVVQDRISMQRAFVFNDKECTGDDIMKQVVTLKKETGENGNCIVELKDEVKGADGELTHAKIHGHWLELDGGRVIVDKHKNVHEKAKGDVYPYSVRTGKSSDTTTGKETFVVEVWKQPKDEKDLEGVWWNAANGQFYDVGSDGKVKIDGKDDDTFSIKKTNNVFQYEKGPDTEKKEYTANIDDKTGFKLVWKGKQGEQQVWQRQATKAKPSILLQSCTIDDTTDKMKCGNTDHDKKDIFVVTTKGFTVQKLPQQGDAPTEAKDLPPQLKTLKVPENVPIGVFGFQSDIQKADWIDQNSMPITAKLSTYEIDKATTPQTCHPFTTGNNLNLPIYLPITKGPWDVSKLVGEDNWYWKAACEYAKFDSLSNEKKIWRRMYFGSWDYLRKNQKGKQIFGVTDEKDGKQQKSVWGLTGASCVYEEGKVVTPECRLSFLKPPL